MDVTDLYRVTADERQGELFPMLCCWPNHTGAPVPVTKRRMHNFYGATPICGQCEWYATSKWLSWVCAVTLRL
jgi:hypothetical protein